MFDFRFWRDAVAAMEARSRQFPRNDARSAAEILETKAQLVRALPSFAYSLREVVVLAGIDADSPTSGAANFSPLLSSDLPCALVAADGVVTQISPGLSKLVPDLLGKNFYEELELSQSLGTSRSLYGTYRDAKGLLAPVAVYLCAVEQGTTLAVIADGKPFRDADVARFESSTQGILRIDDSGTITLANRAAVRLLGLDSSDDLKARELTLLFEKGQEGSIRNAVRACMRDGTSHTLENLPATIALSNAAGPFRLTVMPDAAPGSKLLGAIAIIQSFKSDRTKVHFRNNFEVARLVAADLSRSGLSPEPDIVNDLKRIDLARKSGKLELSDELRLNEIVARLLVVIRPRTLDDILKENTQPPWYRRIWTNLANKKLNVIATGVNLFGVFLTLAVIALTTEFNTINASLAPMQQADIPKYFELLGATFEVWKSNHGQPATDVAAQTHWSENVKQLRQIDGVVTQASLKFVQIFDVQSSSPLWCTMFLRLYGLGEHCHHQSYAPATATNTEPSDLSKFASGLLGLSITEPSQTQVSSIIMNNVQDIIILLGSSMLPLLYGFLGATVFLMRKLFGEGTDVFGARLGPQGEPALLLGRVLLRLCLGGVAGLAIGWFWTPASSKSIMEATSFSTTPFALAFLAGFSIELLFSILDRILAAINPATQGK